jgi:hypothetical protein
MRGIGRLGVCCEVTRRGERKQILRSAQNDKVKGNDEAGPPSALQQEVVDQAGGAYEGGDGY